MGRLRLARRLLLFSCFTLFSFLALVLSVPLVRLFGRNVRRHRSRVLTGWSRGCAFILGMRIVVRGTAPPPPFFLVSNHLSYVDILVIASQAPCAFIAKSEISSWPIFGRLCRAVGTVFIERESKRDIPRVIETIERTLREDVGVVLFPEATSSKGGEVLPFRPSLFEAAARARMPVSYASLSYRTPGDSPPAHEVVCWWGDMTFGRHLLALFQLREFEASVIFGERTIESDDRKLLAEMLQRAVEQQFEPVVREAPSA